MDALEDALEKLPDVPEGKDDLTALKLLFNDVSKSRILTKEAERELGMNKSREDSLRRLVEANVRWAVKIALKYGEMANIRNHMEMEDVLAEGFCGLIRAAQKFDPDKGRFTTYATFWIGQFIGRASINQRGVVRVPVHRVKRANKVRKCLQKIMERHGVDDPRLVVDEVLAAGFTQEEVENAIRVENIANAVSLDDEETGASYRNISCDTEQSPENIVEREDTIRVLRKIIDDMDKIDADIVKRHFGIDRAHPQTIQDISNSTGHSIAYVRKRLFFALETLREEMRRLGFESA